MDMPERTANSFVTADGFNAMPGGYVTMNICKDPISDGSTMSAGVYLVRPDKVVQIHGGHQQFKKHGLARVLKFLHAGQSRDGFNSNYKYIISQRA